MDHYTHRQVGWLLNAIITVTVVAIAVPLVFVSLALLAIPLLVMATVALFFRSMTVTVDDAVLEVRFGAGLIRRRFSLDAVRSFARVRNPWYYGWGIHGFPGGTVYNISGFDAVELAMADGRRVRIGTDEPDALMAVLARRVGALASGSHPATESSGPGLGILFALLPVPVVVTLLIVVLSRQPVKTTIENGVLTIRGGGYSDTVPLQSIERVTLESELPSRMQRTNGLAALGALRGHFRLSDGQRLRLFVERGHAPYIAIRANGDYVWFDLGDEERTRAMFDMLATVPPER